MKSASRDRSSLPAAIGLQCALLSLASGAVGLAVAFMLWWRIAGEFHALGQQAGLFSAALGLALAGIGLASPRRFVRSLAIAALAVNVLILGFTLDSIFSFVP